MNIGNDDGILFDSAITALEHSPGDEKALSAAKNALAARLRAISQTATTEDVEFSRIISKILDGNATSRREAAICVIRALPHRSVFDTEQPDPQLPRLIVSIIESGLPEVAEEARLPSAKQTYEKYAIAEQIYSQICSRAECLRQQYLDADALLAMKQPILRCLNNNSMRGFFGASAVQHVRASAEALLNKLSAIRQPQHQHFAAEVQALQRLLALEKAYVEANFCPFITHFYCPFLNTIHQALHKLIDTARSRFRTHMEIRAFDGALQKRYPLREPERLFTIQIPFDNSGPGDALNLRAKIEFADENVIPESDEIFLGNIPPGEFSLFTPAMVASATDAEEIMVDLYWRELGLDEERRDTFLVRITAQSTGVDWQALEYDRPYTTEVARGDEFVGRREKVIGLANRLLRTPIESCYITGQKRVGKTSLALAAVDTARAHPRGVNIVATYLLWGKIAREGPRESVKELGERLRDFLIEYLPEGATVPRLNFEGSLAPITRLTELLYRERPDLKFVIILDEFDEIHPELYRFGNLAEAFFANIRALSTEPNVGMILVGGENMPFVMDRQGQKLNKFVKERLDYFSRDKEWDDFVELVRRPSIPYIHWHNDAISEIFHQTNGNPYFAKITCAAVFANAVRERDSDITSGEVAAALIREITSFDTNSFIHLWQDGALSIADDKDVIILRRCRVLVAIARTVRKSEELTVENIVANKSSLDLQDYEIPPVLTDFCRREILKEKAGRYEFVLPLFRHWLVQAGFNSVVADTLGDEIARQMQTAEDKAFVTDAEITSLVKGWSLYQGRLIGASDVRSWLSQVQTHQDQRLLFKLLCHVRFFSEAEVREKLKLAHNFVRPYLPQFIQTRRIARREDVLITYVDGEGKSGQFYASRYAEENGISTRSILNPSRIEEDLRAAKQRIGQSPRNIIIVDDIIGTGNSLVRNVRRTLARLEAIADEGPRIFVIALTATATGEERVRSDLAKLKDFSIDLRICEPLSPTHIAFDEANGIFEDDAERARAVSLCRDLGSQIYLDNPLGYGGQGLLVVFPQTIPNNSLPILHSESNVFGQWVPLFPRPVN